MLKNGEYSGEGRGSDSGRSGKALEMAGSMLEQRGAREPAVDGGRRSGHQTAKNQIDVPIQECFVDRRT
jgi:hypothetical protein